MVLLFVQLKMAAPRLEMLQSAASRGPSCMLFQSTPTLSCTTAAQVSILDIKRSSVLGDPCHVLHQLFVVR